MKLSEFSFFDEKSEKDQLLADMLAFNIGKVNYQPEKTIPELFTEQVERTPENVALIFEDERVTYKELDRLTNRLAHRIRVEYRISFNNELKPGVLIGLCVDRSIDMVVGVIGILKAGGAYVPLDPSYPEERLSFILRDTETKVVVTQERVLGKAPFLVDNGRKTICVDDKTATLNILTDDTPEIINKHHDVAYVIYTSGTTGVPKGVLVSHYNVARLFSATANIYDFNDNDVWCLFHSFTFDFTVWEIWGALLHGGTLVIVPYLVSRDTEKFYHLVKDEKITVLNQTPSAFQQFIAVDSKFRARVDSLRYVIFGGEALNVHQLKSWWDKYGDVSPQLINMYGITETTVHVTYYKLSRKNLDNKGYNSPIGVGLHDLRLYVLDEELKPALIGSPGELYVGGGGVAIGYLNRRELTAERFIENRFAQEDDKACGCNLRLYKTGDLVRWLPDKNLEYLGRTDHQVKIRGFRIELGEIESVLTKHHSISQCVVMPRKEENIQQLIAYYLLKKECSDGNKHVERNDLEAISSWEDLYDGVYSENSGNGDVNTYDFSGWNSTYTREPIAEDEMREWTEKTTERIIDLKPTRIFEIGSGTGLLMYRLAPRCEKYIGVDISSKVIERLKRSLPLLALDNVELFSKPAHEILELEALKDEDHGVDTVILNSIIQYFPELSYLEKVLSLALQIVRNGRIFLGDVRDYRLIKTFHLSVELYKESQKGDKFVKEELKALVENGLNSEKELLVSPEYFIDFATRNSAIKRVELLPKLGYAVHEMNCYRYDVVLHVGEGDSAIYSELNWIDWDGDNVKPEQMLKSNENVIAVKGVPNKRVLEMHRVSERLFKEDKEVSTPERMELSEEADSLAELEDIYKIAEKHDYVFRPFLSLDGDGVATAKHDLLFYKKGLNVVFDCRTFSKFTPSDKLSNYPLAKLSDISLDVQELRSYLGEQLPDYMIPFYFVRLDKMPLTSNGKIDRNALPDPEVMHKSAGSDYEAPDTDIEKELVVIWEDVLRQKGIGVTDNFFDLGGHSLLVAKLTAKISVKMKVDVPLMTIFNKPTIRELSEYIFIADKVTSVAEDEVMICLNEKKSGKNIFAFPSGSGYSLGYIPLASMLNEYAFFGFNYIDTMNCLSEYADRITMVDPDGPHILFGWSAGGNMAFHVAKELERRGKRVAAIVMVSSGQRLINYKYATEKVEEIADGFVNDPRLKPYFTKADVKEKFIEQLKRYYAYNSRTIDMGSINADVHLVLSGNSPEFYRDEDGSVVMSMKGWADVTKGVFITYQGDGEHHRMLEDPNLVNNASLLKEIFGELFSSLK